MVQVEVGAPLLIHMGLSQSGPAADRRVTQGVS